MKKKVATWHKNKTAPKNKKVDGAHWIQSRARLTKILEAAGMTPEKPTIMLPRNHDR